MPAVSLYGFDHSPFYLAIGQALRALGVPFTAVWVPSWDRSPIARLTGGQYYQVPVLVHGGEVVFEQGGDSQDVAEYVEATFGDGRLFPAPAAGLHEILLEFIENRVEDLTFRLVDPFYVDSLKDVGERTMVVRHKERKFGRGCIETWRRDLPQLRAEADRLLARFEAMLGRSPYLLGDRPVYADFSLFGIVRAMAYGGYHQLGPDQAALAGWAGRLEGFRY